MSARLGIGWLAAQTGRSVHAIRWYEMQGLLPGVARDSGGRRAFDPQHVQWLELMDRLRQSGMSIAEMRRYTVMVKQGRSTVAERARLLEAHRARVVQTVARWKRALALIDRKIEFYSEWEKTGRRPPQLPSAPAKRARRSGRGLGTAGAGRPEL